jgi:transposase
MKRWVGVDLHKKSFTVCWISKNDEEGKFEEYLVSDEGYEAFRKNLNKSDEVAVEATGSTGYFCDKIADCVGRIAIINPRQFKLISESVNKTDEKDSKLMAQYLKLDLLPEIRPLKKDDRDLRSLIHMRDKLVHWRSGLKNRIHGVLNANGITTKREMFSSESSLKWLSDLDLSESIKCEIEIMVEQIKSLNDSIKKADQRVKDEKKDDDDHKRLISITGIGDLSAAIISNAIGDIEDFEDSKKLCAYAGLTPSVRSSGGKELLGRITRRGNKLLRTTLVQAALVAIRYNGYLRSFYERIKSKKGSGKAIIATARKMLEIIYRTLKNKWEFADFNNWVLK